MVQRSRLLWVSLSVAGGLDTDKLEGTVAPVVPSIGRGVVRSPWEVSYCFHTFVSSPCLVTFVLSSLA